MTSPRRRNKGFTLVEIIIVMVLISVLAGISLTLLSDNVISAARVTKNAGTADQARYAVERLTREIRQMQRVNGAYQVTTSTAGALTFLRSDSATTSTTVKITSTSGTTGNVSLAYGAGAAQTLLNGSITFSLSYFDVDGIATTDPALLSYIDLSLAVTDTSTGLNVPQRQRISLRNQ